ncbi:hypothetical protein TIFTF001_020964 [Ficus carica]|uniref:Uncharacterized protein n=1 Tax=Ficus carica TaxID=3494 RepID=A0AA88AGN5_FICCA|nr:hypothetical protein TIFTF001_020964 [Ficus carica]
MSLLTMDLTVMGMSLAILVEHERRTLIRKQGLVLMIASEDLCRQWWKDHGSEETGTRWRYEESDLYGVETDGERRAAAIRSRGRWEGKLGWRSSSTPSPELSSSPTVALGN